MVKKLNEIIFRVLRKENQGWIYIIIPKIKLVDTIILIGKSTRKMITSKEVLLYDG